MTVLHIAYIMQGKSFIMWYQDSNSSIITRLPGGHGKYFFMFYTRNDGGNRDSDAFLTWTILKWSCLVWRSEHMIVTWDCNGGIQRSKSLYMVHSAWPSGLNMEIEGGQAWRLHCIETAVQEDMFCGTWCLKWSVFAWGFAALFGKQFLIFLWAMITI